MRFAHILKGSGWAGGWPRELLLTAIALIAGFVLMPVLIFFAGSALLGRYEGASVGRLFASVYEGFRAGSPASWIVLLGPYALWLTFRALRLWWRAGS
ncbi:MAG: hypothetical protein ABSG30_14675 [Steroidobacteraceae bacterium]|jgi:hypothetical protein